MPDIDVISTLHALYNLILITALHSVYFYHPRFTDEEPEAQTYKTTCLK